MNKYLIGIFLIIFQILHTQIVFPQNNRFEHYTVDEGLSQSVVNFLYQDSQGFIWIGTQDGLNKFNGYTFEKYVSNPVDSNTLANNWIYSVAEDKNKTIWIGTKNGLHSYYPNTHKIKRHLHLSTENNVYKDFIYGIAVDNDNNVYTNTPPLLNRYNPKTQKFEHFQNTLGNSSAIEDQCFPLLIDDEGLIWIATSSGLSCFNPVTRKFENFVQNNSSNSISNNYITSIYQDSEKNIWIGTRNGLNCYNKRTKKIINIRNLTGTGQDFIRSIVQDNKKNFWIGTIGNGLIRCKIQNGIIVEKSISRSSTERKSEYLCNDFVLSLLIDRSRNLWVGTLNGLDKTDLKRKKFALYRKSSGSESVDLLDNVIASVYKDKNDVIWIGNWGKGLNLYNRKTGEVIHYSTSQPGKFRIANNFVHVIFEDSKTNIWIGTQNGVFIFNQPTKSFLSLNAYFKTNSLPDFSNNRCFSIIEDHLGKIWVGTANGLYVLDIDNKSYKIFNKGNDPKHSISENLVYKLIQDHENNVWIGTIDGLNEYRHKTDQIVHYKHNPSSTNTLCDNFIVSLCEDSEGHLWIGTKNGVNCFIKKDSVFKFYPKADGFLPDNTIYDIIQDQNNKIWFATGNGLSVFSKETNTFRTFLLEDGLQSVEFNLNASYKSKDGEIFFGGMNGLNSFYPDSIKDNHSKTNMVFTAFYIESKSGKKIIYPNDGDTIRITPDDIAFTIEFAGLEFTNQLKNQYAYIMGDYNDFNWIDIGNRRFVPFSNTSPGTYFFKVKGSNNDGVWTDKEIMLKIIVEPPLWKSKTAIVIYLILIIAVVIAVIKIREKNLKHHKFVLEQKVAERTRTVEQQKEEIEAINHELLVQRDEITSHRDKLAKSMKQISDSIYYAKRIQNAVLPPEDVIRAIIPESFVLYIPRDIVSGDFYWIKQIHNNIVISVADCTGHGVPGAFMSMMGITMLNETVSKLMESWLDTSVTSAEILNELRQKIKTALRQTGKFNENKDGMDMVFCIINTDLLTLNFAGANNNVLVVRNKGEERKLIELKGDKMPVGVYLNEEISFTEKTIHLLQGDTIYLFSDGYEDQFGGVRGRKFLAGRLKTLICEIAKLPLEKQKETLEKHFFEWKGTLEQVDDVVIMGVKIQ